MDISSFSPQPHSTLLQDGAVGVPGAVLEAEEVAGGRDVVVAVVVAAAVDQPEHRTGEEDCREDTPPRLTEKSGVSQAACAIVRVRID